MEKIKNKKNPNEVKIKTKLEKDERNKHKPN